MTARKEQIEEEVTRYENQDRVIREKCIHLEGQTRKNEKQIEDQDYEIIKLQKDLKD